MTEACAPMQIKLRYVHRDRDRHGTNRVYFWRRPGPKVRLAEPPGSPEFMARYHALLAGETPAPAPKPGIGRDAAGTLGWLATRYLASPEFKALDFAGTQRVRRRIIDAALAEPVFPGARETYAEFPLSRLTPKAIRALRDRKRATPEGANNRLKAFRRLFAWAIEHDMIAANPARDLKLIATASDGHHTWTEAEIAQFEARHPIGSKARLAMALFRFTGMRLSDAAKTGPQHSADGWLRFTAWKGRNRARTRIEIPVLPELAQIIAASPCGDLAFLVTEHGRPFSIKGLGNWFRERCDEAGLPHCSAHGLRKAGATRAAEGGASPHQMMPLFGWTTLQQPERYTRAANRRKLAAAAIHLLAAAPDDVPTAATSPREVRTNQREKQTKSIPKSPLGAQKRGV